MSEPSKFEKLLVERDGKLYLQHPKTVTTTILRTPHKEVCLGVDVDQQGVIDALTAIAEEERFQVNFGWSMTFETYEVDYHFGQYDYKDFDPFMERYKQFLLANADYIKQNGHPPITLDPEATTDHVIIPVDTKDGAIDPAAYELVEYIRKAGEKKPKA